MIPGLRARLGEATERLYLRLIGVSDQAEGEARRALCRIALDAACGAYHDFRSSRTAPKGALVDDLQAVSGQAAAAEQIAAIVKEVIAGWYDDGDEEARRWVREIAPERGQHGRGAERRHSAPAPKLCASDIRVLEFVRQRYAAERRLVTCNDVCSGIGTSRIASHEVLKRLSRKGAVIDMGKGAGYLPAYVAT